MLRYVITQGTLFLAMEILLLEENGYVDLRQKIGHLINAIVAVLGPELAPGSTFFSRCKVGQFLLYSGNLYSRKRKICPILHWIVLIMTVLLINN